LINDITVIGTGYVGLVTGTCLSDFGLNVLCIDQDEDKINKLNKGIIPIYEPGLQELVKKNYSEKRLRFSTDIIYGIQNAEVVFIAVGTPPKEDGSADLDNVVKVAQTIAKHMNGPKVVVNKSTVPIGTARLVKKTIEEIKTGPYPVDVVSNPEFLREGAAVYDFMHPDRVVVGADNPEAIEIMKQVYRVLFLNQKTPFLFTSPETAEAVKYVSNAFLAMKITFINELSELFEKTGINIVDVARGMGMDGRIGSKFLNPGPGYGGSCFPKDTRALAKISRNYDVTLSLVEATIAANEKQKNRMVEKIQKAMGSLQGKTVAVLGLAFKPETDDMRESPALTIIPELVNRGATIKAYDPKAIDEAEWRLEGIPNLKLVDSPYEAASGAHALVILTEWNQFRSLNLDRLYKIMKEPIFIDLRNIYEPNMVRQLGFNYHSVGRP
jgi:UDPglucose 6-dehydrogenase